MPFETKWNEIKKLFQAVWKLYQSWERTALDLIWAPVKDTPARSLLWFPISSALHLFAWIWLGLTWLSSEAPTASLDEQPVPVTDKSVRVLETQRHPTALGKLLMLMWQADSEQRWHWVVVVVVVVKIFRSPISLLFHSFSADLIALSLF